MTVISHAPRGWRGCSTAKLVKLDSRKRFQVSGRRVSVTYAITATINGKEYLFPASKDGKVRGRAIPM